MHLTTEPQNICGRIEGINNSIIIVGDFNAPLSITDRTTRQKIDKETGLEQHCKAIRLNSHILNTPLSNSRINILLKCTWDIPWDRSYVRPQNKF